jgi:hypothetical protein
MAGRSCLQDRTAAVVDGFAPDDHGLDAPADGVGGVWTGQVFVAGTVVLGREPLVFARGDHGQGKDGPSAFAQRRREGFGIVLIELAVQDGQRDVAAAVEQGLELEWRVDGDGLEPGSGQLGANGIGLVGWKGDDNRGSGHR